MICELTASFRQLVVRWATGNDHVVDLEPARSSDEGTVDGPMAPPDPVRPPEQPSGIWLS
ncbi:MAG: hypothetical protein R2710_03375 [Acidimicrobiales bacterium]